jgi:hypothetical protein
VRVFRVIARHVNPVGMGESSGLAILHACVPRLEPWSCLNNSSKIPPRKKKQVRFKNYQKHLFFNE